MEETVSPAVLAREQMAWDELIEFLSDFELEPEELKAVLTGDRPIWELTFNLRRAEEVVLYIYSGTRPQITPTSGNPWLEFITIFGTTVRVNTNKCEMSVYALCVNHRKEPQDG